MTTTPAINPALNALMAAAVQARARINANRKEIEGALAKIHGDHGFKAALDYALTAHQSIAETIASKWPDAPPYDRDGDQWKLTDEEVRRLDVMLHAPEWAAVRTLQGLGYTHTGGVEWRPPYGLSPDTRDAIVMQIAGIEVDMAAFYLPPMLCDSVDKRLLTIRELIGRPKDIDAVAPELEDVVPPEERAVERPAQSMQELVAGIIIDGIKDGTIPAAKAAQPALIAPTIGRRVWFRPDPRVGSSGFICNSLDQPMDAGVVFVWHERMVNLDVCDHAGNHHAFTSVTLVQPGDTPPDGAYCEWMDYQKGQAK